MRPKMYDIKFFNSYEMDLMNIINYGSKKGFIIFEPKTNKYFSVVTSENGFSHMSKKYTSYGWALRFLESSGFILDRSLNDEKDTEFQIECRKNYTQRIENDIKASIV